MKKIVSVFLVVVLLFTFVPFSKTLGMDVGITASAAGEGVYAKLNSLRNKFPGGYFWNHKVTAYSNNGDQLFNNGDESFADSITGSPCATHNGVASVGQYDCNYFDGGIQCFGFAGKIFYDVFGQRKSGLQKVYNNNYGVSVGDYVRVNNDSHSAVVLTKSGDYITVVECNLSGDGNAALNCKIRWDATYPISSITYYCHATNYAQIDGSSANFYQSVSATNVTETDAYIEASIIGTNLSTCGFYIGKSTSSMDKVTETVNGYVEKMYYNVQADYKALEPGTKYYYKFFLTIGGTEYCSDVYSFTTAGSSLVTGTCGANLTWMFNEATGLLTVSGTGDMDDYTLAKELPWHNYESNIKKVVINKGITSIGNYAFAYCENITSITIPESLTKIGEHAFYQCTSLTSVTIPEGVTSIGDSAFAYCEGLTSIVVPKSVKSIKHMAFAYCNNLESAVISEGVTSLSYAFFRCTNLAKISLPDSLISLDRWSFYDTKYYNDSTNWEDGVLYCGNHLIAADSETLDGTYVVKEGTRCIAAGAFMDCANLVNVVLPDTTVSIGYRSFEYCTKLEGLTIPASVVSVGSAFDGCSSFIGFTVAEDNLNYSSDEFGVLYNKDKTVLHKYPQGNYRTDFEVPDSVTEIASSAFELSRVTNVVVPDSVSVIGFDAFARSPYLEKVELPNGITTIKSYMFWACSSLKSINIPESVTKIENNAFGSCANLTEITIPHGVTRIDEGTFSSCANLTEITIPNSVTYIDRWAFGGCENLVNVHYTGTEVQWGEINISESLNDPLLNANIHYCEKTAEVLPACEKEGYTEGIYCPDCEKYVHGHEVIPASGHDYVLTEIPATCTTAGEKVYTCECGDTYSETIPALGHNPEYYRVEPTCTEEGYECYKCTNCGTEYSRETIPVTSHKYSVTAETPATCTASGSKTYTCECGDTYSETVPALGHNPEYFKVEPTCTEEGYECYKCTNCGTEYSRETIPASGHSYEDEIITEPTCIGEGLKRCTCSACGDSYEETMPLADHTITTIRKDPTCTAIGNEQYMCEVCKNMIGDMVILPKAPHSYGEWTITAPTATEAGSKDHSCMSCGKTETVLISATGFETVEGVAIDFATNTITGFKAGETSLNSYTMTVNDNSIWEYETLNGRLGTGSKAILKNGDAVIGEYTILIFGDVNGDSWYDGQDAVLASCLANGMLSKDNVSESVYRAADCNHDGVIDQLDIDLLNQAGAMLTNVDQSEQAEVLFETSSEYVEYLDLVDQSSVIEIEDETEIHEADTDTEETPETDEANTTQQSSAELKFFDMIIKFIKSIFDRLCAYVPDPLK